MSGESPEVIRAAGGIVMGVRRNSGKIAIIRRRRHGGDIGLPKGKLKAGESEAEAALREVGEETGFRVAVRQAAGTTYYSVDGQPKAVAYFMMEALDDTPALPRDTKEVKAVEWLTPTEAIGALTYEEDRQLIANVFDIRFRTGST